MPRPYTHILQFEDDIFQLKRAGYSNRDIGNILGLSLQQVKDVIKRHNRREKQIGQGNVPKPAGRPRVRPLTTEENLRKENERLRMQNELLRDFLSETERM